MRREIPWNWFRPGPERDAARARDKRRLKGISQATLARAKAEGRAATKADRDAEIRQLWSLGARGTDLAERYGLAKSTVCSIVADLPKRPRRYGDPWDIAWPHPRRRYQRRSEAPRGPRAFDKVGPPDPRDTLGDRGAIARGSAHGRSKLTEDLVVEMKRLRSEGWSTGRLAGRYGVARATICYALKGVTWSEVGGNPS